jgi:hypothetical protein
VADLVRNGILYQGDAAPSLRRQRNLPARIIPALDDRILRDARHGDYLRLKSRLAFLLAEFVHHVDMHALEAGALAGLSDDGHRILAYISDLGVWCSWLEIALSEDTSAVPREARSVFAGRIRR